MFTIEEGNVNISSCIIYFANAREDSKKILRRLTLKYFEKVAKFSIRLSFTVKVFL